MILGFWAGMPANAEPRSPWRDGEAPQSLLPDEVIEDPLDDSTPTIPRVDLSDCIQVGGYIVCPTKANYLQAVAACSVMDAALATLETQQEAAQLGTLVHSLTEESVHIGLSDEETEGEWLWLDGSPLTYDPWSHGEPNDFGLGENCVAMGGQDGENWNDVPCSHPMAFVCELRGN